MTMEEATIIGRPSVANLLKISRELIVESFESTLQCIEGLLKLPDRGGSPWIFGRSPLGNCKKTGESMEAVMKAS